MDTLLTGHSLSLLPRPQRWLMALLVLEILLLPQEWTLLPTFHAFLSINFFIMSCLSFPLDKGTSSYFLTDAAQESPVNQCFPRPDTSSSHMHSYLLTFTSWGKGY